MRAISILLVVAWHLRSNGSAPWLDPLWRVDTGNLGVRVFFVISGFLITSVLLAEYARSGTIALRRFYVRRAFRIMPVFYVFLAVMAIGGALGLLEAPLSSVLLAGTYTGDYTHLSWSVGHTWSLAVEEQFYLLWPGHIVLLGLRRAFLWRRRDVGDFRPQSERWRSSETLAHQPAIRLRRSGGCARDRMSARVRAELGSGIALLTAESWKAERCISVPW